MASRASLMSPFIITAAPTATPILPGLNSLDGFWIQIAVRTMGTSGWVGIGNSASQASLLYNANDFLVWDCPPGYVINFADFYATSENGDAVLEITGMRPVDQPSGLLPSVIFPTTLVQEI